MSSEPFRDRFELVRTPVSAKFHRQVAGLELPRSVQKNPENPKNEDFNDFYDEFFGPIVNNESEGRQKISSSFMKRLSIAKNTIVKVSVSSKPVKVLAAAGLVDDFYLNLVDWEPVDNLVTVMLDGEEVHFWQNGHKEVDEAGESEIRSFALGRGGLISEDEIGCVVKWSTTGGRDKNRGLLAVGSKTGKLEIWDCSRLGRVNNATGDLLHHFSGHQSRLGVIAWQGENVLTTGSKDQRIIHWDLRVPGGRVLEAHGHRQEICGLKWDRLGSGLLASGGNDNQLLIWDLRRHSSSMNPSATRPLLRLNAHTAAVKAIDWSPHQSGLLASGGGTADRTIRFWNTRQHQHNKVEYSEGSFRPIQATSQVCTLAWSPFNATEILSTHGFSEHNLNLWSYPTGTQLATLEGHSQRVLYQAMSPDGTTVVTGSGDETLRFWNVFRRTKAPKGARQSRNDDLENVFYSSR